MTHGRGTEGYPNYINDKLSKHDLVRGLLKHKYDQDQVYNAYEKGIQVRASFKPLKTISYIKALELLRMEIYGHVRLRSLGDGQHVFVVANNY